LLARLQEVDVLNSRGSCEHLVSVAGFCALILLGACGWSSGVIDAYGRYDSFGRRFIDQFHAGGVAQAREFIEPATLRLPDAEGKFALMRSLLPSAHVDSVRPADGIEIEEGWGSGGGYLRYRVYGPDRVAEVELWIVRARKRMLVETVRITDVTASASEPGAAPDAARR
jgi:hypothetical protein